jgi:glutamine synthetase
MCYEVTSEEFPWEGSYFERIKKSYHTPSPFDAVAKVRDEITRALEDYFGVEVEMHHHEVASGGQVEIDIKYGGILRTADNVTTVKYVARNIAALSGYTAVFMPKPFAGDNGNGMHTHVSIWSIRNGEAVNLFHDDNDELGLSQFARYFIGGLIEHGRALAALVAPTVNSYRRLVPGYEAPVYLVWGPGNRSAAIRVPAHARSPSSKRIEFRPPDPTANPYLAFTAIVAAGLDGVNKKIEPGDPVTENVYKMPIERRKAMGIKELPRSLEEALDELESDSEFLQGYIDKSVIEAYIEAKRAEARMIKEYPSPIEFYVYNSL